MSFGSAWRRNIVIPLWIARDRSPRLEHYRELKKSQYWSREDLAKLQVKKLRDTLTRAHENTRYYRTLFDSIGFDPRKFSSLDQLTAIPILEKGVLRNRFDDLRSKKHLQGRLTEFKTGGSTGKPTVVVKDSETVELSNGSAYRVFEWAGAKLGEPWGLVWGNPPVHTSLKAKLRDYLIDREIYLDTMNMTAQSMLAFCDEWQRAKPTMLRGHSHSIFIFASFCVQRGITSIRPNGIISSSMMLLPTERRVIEQAFACKVTDLYGCEEVGLIGCECEKHDGLHIDMENLYVEIVDPAGNPVPDGQEGAVVVTSLIADAMPIIRYRMGDITSYRTKPCPCGRGLASINNVAGRVADFFVKPDGGLVAGVSLVERTLTKFPGIAQLQMVQPDRERLILKIVRDRSYTAETQQNIVDELKSSVGCRSVEIEFVDAIPQEHNGKYRFAISHVQNPFSVS